jgi:mono/diheme cytochrome c family protein
LAAILLTPACGSDDKSTNGAAGSGGSAVDAAAGGGAAGGNGGARGGASGSSAGSSGAAGSATDAGGDRPMTPATDGGSDTAGDRPVTDASGDGPVGDTTPLSPAAMRGEYLVRNVLNCSGCHTARTAGAPFLGGVKCFVDTMPPADNGMGCLHSPNLTNHATGLANVANDAQIKDMITKGVRPDGKAMFVNMPSYIFHLLADADADAVVAFLRSLPGVDNRVGENEPPFNTRPAMPAPGLTLADLPAVAAGAMNADSANKGKPLTAFACLGCHTPNLPAMPAPPIPLDLSKAFNGGNMFAQYMMMNVSSANLTSDDTGLKGWSADDVIKVLKMGIDKKGMKVCPPMGQYPGLSDADTRAIADYVVALPAKANMVAAQCVAP